ncbi:MAG: SPOR domain-containing protein [Rickettsiales bacterium]|nr:SPOR domain-containing protein [Rickettsiales bacterium]
MKNDYDADDDIPLDELEGAGLRWMSVVVVLLVVGGFFALAWYAYHSNSANDVHLEDVVKAEAQPVKEKPADPGGMVTPYQDMSVYNVISKQKNGTNKQVEQLLPDPEEPMASREEPAPAVRPNATASRHSDDMKVWLKDEGEVDPLAKEPPAKVKLLPAPVTPATVPEVQNAEPAFADVPESSEKTQANQFMASPAEKIVTAETTSKPETSLPPIAQVTPVPLMPKIVPEVAPQVVKTPVTPAVKPVAVKKTAPAPSSLKETPKIEAPKPETAKTETSQQSGSMQAQIAALKTPAEATATWNLLKKKHADLLAGKQYLIVKADLPQGTFYRLRLSGLTAASAKQLCASLMARKQSCLVVR